MKACPTCGEAGRHSREPLERAREIFVTLGATPWVAETDALVAGAAP